MAHVRANLEHFDMVFLPAGEFCMFREACLHMDKVQENKVTEARCREVGLRYKTSDMCCLIKTSPLGG